MRRGSPLLRGTMRVALMVLVAALAGLAARNQKVTTFKSPDRQLAAVVSPADRQKGVEANESRVSILRSDGTQLRRHDFSSADGEHGYGVDGAQWTPNSLFFVFRMRNSGGHMPMYAPVVFWSRKANRFYQLNDYTADQTFSVVAPDSVSVSTWPALKPATMWLRGVRESQITELR